MSRELINNSVNVADALAATRDSEKKNRGFALRKTKKVSENSKPITFKYEATTGEHLRTTGDVVANSYSEAKFKLEHDGLKPLRIVEVKPWYRLEFGRIVSLADLLVATRQLAAFAESGIPLSKAIQVLSESFDNKRMRQSLSELHLEIESGNTFSEALRHQAGIYPSYYVSIVSAAERTGNVTEALNTLSEYLDRDLKSARAVKSALYYPAVLVAIGAIAAILLSVYVLPKFEVFFSQLNANLPFATRLLLNITHFISATWWLGVIVLIAVVVFYMYAKQKPNLKYYVDQLKLKLPIFGSLFRLVALERFCRVLATLVKSHVPLPDALEMSSSATGNQVFQTQVMKVHADVLNGEGLAGPLGKTDVFPNVAVQIFKVGEDSGQLAEQLVQAAGFYSGELDYKMKNFTSLIEPVVLVVIGSVVGFIAVALISAMYGIYSGVQA